MILALQHIFLFYLPNRWIPRFGGHQAVPKCRWQPHEAALGSAGGEFGKAAADGTVAQKNPWIEL